MSKIFVDSIEPKTSGGAVQMPNRPSFFVYNSTNDWFQNIGNGTIIQFNTAKFNVGNHFNLSTYKFTAPYTGLYQFGIRVYVNYASGNNSWAVFINGTVYHHSNTGYSLFGDLAQGVSNSDFGTTGSHCLQLNANDTVDVRSMHANTDYFGTMTSFSGFFVG